MKYTSELSSHIIFSEPHLNFMVSKIHLCLRINFSLFLPDCFYVVHLRLVRRKIQGKEREEAVLMVLASDLFSVCLGKDPILPCLSFTSSPGEMGCVIV